MTRGRRAPIKAFLLDQRRIAGVGNIYADEALFRARIHPLRPAGSLRRAQLDALAEAVRAALAAGIAAGGATIDDFRHVDGVAGAFQHEFLVHRRKGEPCPVCVLPQRSSTSSTRPWWGPRPRASRPASAASGVNTDTTRLPLPSRARSTASSTPS